MSGPKDFVIVFAAARLAQMAARRAAAEQIRETASRARREAALGAIGRLSAEAVARRTAAANEHRLTIEKQFAELASRNAIQRASAESASKRPQRDSAATSTAVIRVIAEAQKALVSIDQAMDAPNDPQRLSILREIEALATGGHDKNTLKVAEKLRVRIEQMAAQVGQQSRRWQAAIETLSAWKNELSADDAVQQFERTSAQGWAEKAKELQAQPLTIETLDQLTQRAEELEKLAEQMHKEAGERQAKANDRNELLTDIMKSLQEIGFFVSDPQFQDADDPAGPVVIKATRGREEFVASVDLSETVKTIWNGATDERCKESFFDYVDHMKDKGVEIKPTRSDLQSRPILRQAGAQDLPDSRTQRQGG